MAEDYVDEHSSRDFYDHVAVPALRLAENDRHRSTTDTNYRRLVAGTAVCVVREIAEHVQEKASRTARKEIDADNEGGSPSSPPDPSVLCLAGRTELDGAAVEMLAQVLEEIGIGARVLPPIAVSEGALGQLDLKGIEVVCLSYLHLQPQVFARYICRRIRRRAPHVRLMVCCWNSPPHSGQTEDIARQMAADAAVVSIEAGVSQVEAWLSRPSSEAGQAPLLPDNEHARLEALRGLGLTNRNQRFDDVTKKVALAFDAPIALVSLIDEEHQLSPGATGRSSDADGAGQVPRELSVGGHVLAADNVLVAEDVTKDPRFADNPLVLEKGIRFYAGAPLRTSSGLVLGSLCVIDTKPRPFSAADRGRLQEMADQLMSELESPPEGAATEGAADLETYKP